MPDALGGVLDRPDTEMHGYASSASGILKPDCKRSL